MSSPMDRLRAQRGVPASQRLLTDGSSADRSAEQALIRRVAKGEPAEAEHPRVIEIVVDDAIASARGPVIRRVADTALDAAGRFVDSVTGMVRAVHDLANDHPDLAKTVVATVGTIAQAAIESGAAGRLGGAAKHVTVVTQVVATNSNVNVGVKT